MKRRWYIFGLVALVAGTLAVNAQLGRDYTNEFLNTSTGRALMQAYGAIKSGYLTEVDDEVLIRGAITGMVESLDDQFSSYVEPRAAARERQDSSGSFGGIGAVLTAHDRNTGKGVEILTVYQGSPASGAGLQRGDVFLKVDEVDVRNLTSSEVADLVRGPEGTEVTLVMNRPGTEEPLTFVITRGVIQIVDVSSTLLEGNVGYVALSSFNNRLLNDQMVEQIDQLILQGAQSLVLDLRDNPGGLLPQAVYVADEFLEEGPIVYQRSRGVTQLYGAAQRGSYDLPLVVLVNQNSASASEIVAGALQESGRAVVIGEQTFGKGVGQTVISLSDGGQLQYVSFEWLTPDRTSISERGVTPDIIVTDTRFPSTVVAEGRGLREGQTVQLVVDGEVIGEVLAEEDGTFTLLALGGLRETSSVQGQALVDLENDAVLQAALSVLAGETVVGENNN
ncbi:MAG: S41 family peptidase [Trueperaceae bacterium]|jgi:carboxyl-terminal processing protease